MTTETSTANPVYMTCQDCGARARIERLGLSVNIGVPRRCMWCGSERVQSGFNSGEDYWYTLAEAFGFTRDEKGVTLIKGLYELWDTVEFKSFREFVEGLRLAHNS